MKGKKRDRIETVADLLVVAYVFESDSQELCEEPLCNALVDATAVSVSEKAKK